MSRRAVLRLRVFGVTLCLTLLGAAPADAAPTRVGGAQSLDRGPLLAGDALAYTQATTRRFSVRVVRRGRRPAVLARGRLENFDQETSTSTNFVTLGASAQRLAYNDHFSEGNQYGAGASRKLASGPLSGPLSDLSTCRFSAFGTGPPGMTIETVSSLVDVDAEAVAYVDCAGRVAVRNFAPGAPVSSRTIAAGANVGDLALSGRYVAFRVGASVRVFDWLANAPAYSVALAGEDSTALDLQDDGTLAVARTRDIAVPCPAGNLAWYSRAQPFAHRLPVAPCKAQVAIAGGRIAVVAPASRGRRILTAVSLGGARSDLASLGRAGVQAGELDLDATRASFALRNCRGGADLLRASVFGSGPLSSVATTCPVSIRSRRAVLSGRAVRVRVVCRRGCAGRARLVRRAGRRRVGLGRAKAVKLRASRRSRRIRLPLSRGARRLLARQGTLRAQLRIAVSDRNGRARLARRTVVLSAR